MALQIRRGTNKERLQITPAEGELIYVTDYELVTISATALNATTNVLTSVAHGLTTNQQIRFQDTTKNGLTLNQVYYVASTPDPDNFTLKATLAGATLDITGTYTVPLVFAKTPTNAAGSPLGINVTALWIGDGNTVGGVPGNTQGLDDLTDVQITTPAEGNTLYYDATSKQWKNTNILNIDDVTGTQNITVNGTDASNIIRTNTNTNTVANVANFFSKTTNTPVNGFGAGISFSANNTAGTERSIGVINVDYDSITPNSEFAELTIGLIQNGVSPSTTPAALRINSLGNTYLKGDLTLGVPEITAGTLGVANLYNHTPGPDTINIGNGVVTEVNIGNAAGSRVQIKSPTIVGASTTQDVFNTVATTVNAFGVAESLTLGATTGTTTIRNNAVVTGNLTVNGTTTTVNSTTLTVDDKNIELASTASPSNATANGGGITLRGTTDKKIYWNLSDSRWYYDSGDGAGNIFVRDLTDLTNVETTAFNKGQMFFYNGTNWINGSNIKFDNVNYRPHITTQVNVDQNGQPSPGGINTGLRLVKDTTTTAYTDGAGTGLIMGVNSDSQVLIDVGRLHAQYDAGGAHDVSLLTTTTNNDTVVDLIRTSKNRTNINNGVLYVNAENGRVGINTVSPNLSLEVQGNAYVSSTLEVVSDLTARANLNVGGETITMNYGFTGAPSQDVGIVVERGNETDAYWKWLENIDSWTSSNNIFAGGEIVANGIMGTNSRQMILNNADATPAGTDHATLRVKRGSGNNVFLRWNESSDRWDFTNDGTNYTLIPTAVDTPTYVGLNTTTGNVNVNNKTILRGDNGNVVVGNDIFALGNLLQLNYGQTGQPSINAGIEIERGDQANTTFRWNEGNGRWESTTNGSSYLALPNQALDQASSPIFAALTTNGQITTSGSTALVGVNNKTFLYADTGDVRTGGDLYVGGDFIRLNEKQAGSNPAAFVDAYFIAERGDAPGGDAYLKWNEATDYWNTSHSLLVGGDLTVLGNGYIYSSSNLAMVLNGQDVSVQGNLTISGNTIKKSSGTDVITFSGTNLTTFAGDIKLGGNTVYDSAGNNVLDFKTSTSIYGTSYQAKFNTSVNYGVGCSYLFLDNIVEINTSSKTTTQNSTYEVLDFFDPASYRSAKYIVQISNGTTHQMWEGMVIHDGTDIFVTAYGDIRTNGNLATISVGFNATTGYAELRVTPVNATQTKFKATKTYIVV